MGLLQSLDFFPVAFPYKFQCSSGAVVDLLIARCPESTLFSFENMIVICD
jgi:hypothetical protein